MGPVRCVHAPGLQIVSDVHLEFRAAAPEVLQHAPHIALLGDIGDPFTQLYRDFIATLCQQFTTVLVLVGNHEYYAPGQTPDSVLAQMTSVCASHSNCHFLERTAYQLTADTRVLGCTLWSDLQDVVIPYVCDFGRIHPEQGKLLSASQYRAWHARDVRWIEQQLQEAAADGQRVILLTHHGPSLRMMGSSSNQLDSAFASNLDHLFKPPLVAAASGHVHYNVQCLCRGIPCWTNAMGYPGEHTGYRPDLVLPLEDANHDVGGGPK